MNWKQLLTKPLDIFKKKPKEVNPKEIVDLESFDKKVEEIFSKNEVRTVAKATWKFTDDQRLLMAKLVGQGWTNSEIKQHMLEVHEIKITPNNIEQIRHGEKWKPVIKQVREAYIGGIHDVAGSHKRVRLERAERMYDKAVSKGDIKTGLATIEQQRKEFDKHESNQFVILQQQYSFMSDEEIEERKKILVEKVSNLKKVIKEVQNGNDGNGGVQSKAGK